MRSRPNWQRECAGLPSTLGATREGEIRGTPGSDARQPSQRHKTIFCTTVPKRGSRTQDRDAAGGNTVSSPSTGENSRLVMARCAGHAVFPQRIPHATPRLVHFAPFQRQGRRFGGRGTDCTAVSERMGGGAILVEPVQGARHQVRRRNFAASSAGGCDQHARLLISTKCTWFGRDREMVACEQQWRGADVISWWQGAHWAAFRTVGCVGRATSWTITWPRIALVKPSIPASSGQSVGWATGAGAHRGVERLKMRPIGQAWGINDALNATNHMVQSQGCCQRAELGGLALWGFVWGCGVFGCCLGGLFFGGFFFFLGFLVCVLFLED